MLLRKWSLKISVFFLITTCYLQLAASSSAQINLQEQIDTSNQQIAELNRKIVEYQAALLKIGADKKTLQAAINALNLQRNKVQAQVSITQHKINATQLEIQQLDGQIFDTQRTIEKDRIALARYLQTIQQADGRPFLAKIFSASNLSQFWSDVNSSSQIQEAIIKRTESLREHKDSLADTQDSVQEKQDALAAQKQALASQQQSLAATTKSKSQLLTQTKAQESNYQKLLAAAQKELDSYSAFTRNAGGAQLLPQQTVCDDWGCYYNQRDMTWGGIPLNDTKYSLASDGCLVTSMAMIMTHYGYRNVTPVTINSNSSNFASYFPAFLLKTISVSGVTAARKTATIDAMLATGHPVVVGLKALGGTHFVVLVRGSKGNYVMRDPYVANGKDISFISKYTVRSIYSIEKVVIGG